MMNKVELAARLESRILSTFLDYRVVTNACYEAKEYGFSSVAVFPSMLEMCYEIVGSTNILLNALVSYPHGGMTIAQKAEEAEDAIERGAGEVQFVINTREVLSGNWDYIYEEMKAVRNSLPPQVAVKANFECEYYTESQIQHCCQAALKASVDWIVTSTGEYSYIDENKNDVPVVTSRTDLALIKRTVGDAIRIQAEGNINNLDTALTFLRGGADRVSSSRPVRILKEYAQRGEPKDV